MEDRPSHRYCNISQLKYKEISERVKRKSYNIYPHSERKFATRDITTDLVIKMSPRPSGNHEVFASCVKTKTDAVGESDSSETGDEDTKLVEMEDEAVYK